MSKLFLRTEHAFVLSLLFFISLLFILPDSLISIEYGNTILTITTFLFGIVGGFYIVVTTTDYNNLKAILATETASWISLYQNTRLLNPQVADKLRELIDTYIIRNFDYELIDHAHTTHKELDTIVREIEHFSYTDSQSWIRENIQEIMLEIIKNRQQLTVLGTKTLSAFQWLVLYILGGLVIFSLYGLRTGEFFFDLVTVTISCAVILIFLLIRDLDLYRWNEQTFGFDIFQNVLRAIGKLPYYPNESLTQGRIHPREKEYRVGILTGGDHFERTIEVRTVQ